MSNTKKTSAIKTPLAFSPISLEQTEDDEDMSEEKIKRTRKLLKDYEELNKLYDICIQRIQSRNEK